MTYFRLNDSLARGLGKRRLANVVDYVGVVRVVTGGGKTFFALFFV